MPLKAARTNALERTSLACLSAWRRPRLAPTHCHVAAVRREAPAINRMQREL